MVLTPGAAAEMYHLGEGALISADTANDAAAEDYAATAFKTGGHSASSTRIGHLHEEVRIGLLGLPSCIRSTALSGAATLRGVLDSRRVDQPGTRRKGGSDHRPGKADPRGIDESAPPHPPGSHHIPDLNTAAANSSSSTLPAVSGPNAPSAVKSEEQAPLLSAPEPLPRLPSKDSVGCSSLRSEPASTGHPVQQLALSAVNSDGGKLAESGDISHTTRTKILDKEDADDVISEPDDAEEGVANENESDCKPDTASAAKAAFKEKMLR